MALDQNGVITREELINFKQIVSDERYKKGPVAVIECIQEIPCNPCEAACAQGAIKIGMPITELPILDEDLCTGCSICIAKCPGLAIFMVDKTYSDTQALISFPYEYTPLPEKDEIVSAVSREGVVMSEAKVIKVMNPKSFDRTPVVTIAVPKEMADDIRSMKRK